MMNKPTSATFAEQSQKAMGIFVKTRDELERINARISNRQKYLHRKIAELQQEDAELSLIWEENTRLIVEMEKWAPKNDE